MPSLLLLGLFFGLSLASGFNSGLLINRCTASFDGNSYMTSTINAKRITKEDSLVFSAFVRQVPDTEGWLAFVSDDKDRSNSLMGFFSDGRRDKLVFQWKDDNGVMNSVTASLSAKPIDDNQFHQLSVVSIVFFLIF
jgi:hypothetical protein